MDGERNSMTVTVDGYTRFCLTVIAVLLTVLIIGLWAAGPTPSAGHAAPPAADPKADRDFLPNAGAQRAAMLRAIETTNDRLQKIINLLESGRIKVVVDQAPVEKAGGNVAIPPQK